MQYLNKEIEALSKRKKAISLMKKQISCGIFQDLEPLDLDQRSRSKKK